MRAFVVSALTEDVSAAALVERPIPQPGPGEVCVRIKAAGVNFVDVLQAKGLHQHKPQPPYTPGFELAGDISAIGEGVTDFSVGQAVWGAARTGAYAEYGVAAVDRVSAMPAGMTYDEAAVFRAVYLTAHVSLVVRGRLQAGETLLVHGAAGGSGLAAVDLGRILGARVIATASTQEKREFLAAYGAHHVLPAAGFRDAVKDLTGGRGADVVFDPVGGDVFDESTRCIAHDGRLLVIGFMSGRIPTLAANIALIKGFAMIGVRAGEYGRQFPERGREIDAALAQLAASGKARIHIHRSYPLTQVRAAWAELEDRRVIGKVV
ncbi:MAG: NADPH:quinone oxidoreductase family protein, partial [Hyphomonadaceae bacterium]